MKKFILISLFFSLIILSWCNQQKEISQDELFEKKQECLNYKENIINNTNDTLTQIFYSQRLNSCLYITKNIISKNDTKYYIYDYLEDTLVFSTSFNEVLKQKIQELK